MGYEYRTLTGKSVCVIKPDNYKPSGRLVIHFHGFRQAPWDDTDAGTVEHFGFLDTLNSVAPDTLMIMPIGTKGQGHTNYSLRRDWGSIHFILPAIDELGCVVDNVILSGHSAGYEPILNILDGGTGDLPVDKVFLFDSLYTNEVKPLNDFLKTKTNRVWNAAIPDGTPFNNSKFVVTKFLNYANTRATKVDHYGTVTKYFPQFLKDSRI